MAAKKIYIVRKKGGGSYGSQTIEAESAEDAARMWASTQSVSTMMGNPVVIVHEVDDGTEYQLGLGGEEGEDKVTTQKQAASKLRGTISLKEVFEEMQGEDLDP